MNISTNRIILLFDEINTNENVSGILKEILVDRCINGNSIDRRIISIACCNPYLYKGNLDMNSAGLNYE